MNQNISRYGDQQNWTQFLSSLREQVDAILLTAEQVQAWFVSDVNSLLQFESCGVVLTNQRLIVISTVKPLQVWSLNEIAKLSTRDRCGMGTLDIVGQKQLLESCHYTIQHATGMLALVDRFDDIKLGTTSVQRLEEVVPEAETTTPPPNTQALLRLWEFASPHASLVILGFLLSLTSTIASLVPPYLTMPLLDDILIPYQNQLARIEAGEQIPSAQQVSFQMAGWYLLGLLIAALFAWILGWAQGAILARVSERITAGLRNRTYSHLMRLSLEYFGGKRTGDLMSRISTDSDRLTSFLSDSVVDFAADCLLILGTAVILVYMDLWLAVVSLFPFPFIVWLMYKSRDQLQHGFAQGGRAWSNMTSVLADTIPGVRVVKAFAQEQREIDRFHAANQQVVQANDRVNSVWTFFWPMIVLLNQLGILVVWGFGIWRVYQNQLSVGELTMFLAYIGRFYSRLETMSRMVNASQRAAASAQRIFEILDRVSSVPDPAKPVPIKQIAGTIELRDVCFRYGNRTVLRNVNLKIEEGEMVGLVGHTGAGKSTMINLICRFFDVAEGAILVDGVDIRSFKVEDYRKNVGIVLQEPFLFFGTIAENIAYGSPSATRIEIVNAARAARAHDFIMQLPDGYDSMVGERGQSLSGGERQRISIARALLVNPRILILDEATSAVDTQTEHEIQAALQNLVRGRTTLAIAHRLSTLRQANRIIVLDHGNVVEVGNHDELLKLNGTYSGLHRAQQQQTHDLGV